MGHRLGKIRKLAFPCELVACGAKLGQNPKIRGILGKELFDPFYVPFLLAKFRGKLKETHAHELHFKPAQGGTKGQRSFHKEEKVGGKGVCG